MKQIENGQDGVLPILDPKLTYIAKATFNRMEPTYYICRRRRDHDWDFANITSALQIQEILGGIAREKYLQNSCQYMLDIRSSSFTISLWQFASWQEFVTCKRNYSI